MKKMIPAVFALFLSLSAASLTCTTVYGAAPDTLTIEKTTDSMTRTTRYHHTDHPGKHIRLQIHSCSFTDTDSNGICDSCHWDEKYHSDHHTDNCPSVSCHITEGHCTSYTDSNCDGYCDFCNSPILQDSASPSQDTWPEKTSSSSATPDQTSSADSQNASGTMDDNPENGYSDYSQSSRGHCGRSHHSSGHHGRHH